MILICLRKDVHWGVWWPPPKGKDLQNLEKSKGYEGDLYYGREISGSKKTLFLGGGLGFLCPWKFPGTKLKSFLISTLVLERRTDRWSSEKSNYSKSVPCNPKLKYHHLKHTTWIFLSEPVKRMNTYNRNIIIEYNESSSVLTMHYDRCLR